MKCISIEIKNNVFLIYSSCIANLTVIIIANMLNFETYGTVDKIVSSVLKTI